jgi:hypothetical protein
MHGRLISVLLCASAVFAPAGAAAQDANAEVLQVVTKLFDGMRNKDTAAMRSVFAPSARLVSAGVTNGASAVSETPIDNWIASVGRSAATLDEKIFSPEVRVDGNLATVWTRYELWVNNAFRHCGYDAFTLAKIGSGWKILNVADSRRTEGCGRD